jgi:hypothetical protein
LELQSHGHEIAHHGFRHKQAVKYANKLGYERWISDEIITLNNWMEKQEHSETKEKFKQPVSFAFPHFHYNEELVSRIIPKFFKISRGHLKEDNLTPSNHVGIAPSICLDDYYSCNQYYLKKIIKLARKSGKNLILTCHSILPEEVEVESFGDLKKSNQWGAWRVDPKLLRFIIRVARENNMEFYTTSEIAGIATFIDKNLERAVREQISLSDDQWINISELLKLKKLDLSNKGITHLGGLEYFLNLEEINLKNNHLLDLRVLKKLPNLKTVHIEDYKSGKSKPYTLAELKSEPLIWGVTLYSLIETVPLVVMI